MKWVKDKPTKAEYYWAMPKDPDDRLDGSPEIVKVYFNGKWSVIRPGYTKHFGFDDFTLWSETYITEPQDCSPDYIELYGDEV